MEKLDSLLKNTDTNDSEYRILVLGYGAIGKAVASVLKNHFSLNSDQIYIYDVNEDENNFALKNGFSVWNKNDFSGSFNVVIGCTGTRSFNVWNYVHLAKESVLISASSGSSELAREEFVEYAISSKIDDIFIRNKKDLANSNIHQDIEIDIVHHRIQIANGGFPINFDGKLNRISAEDIQITVAMMIYGAIQATKTLEFGLISLDNQFCNNLIKEFNRI